MGNPAVQMQRTSIVTTERGIQRGLGWLPDYPDFRDFTWETDTPRTPLGFTSPIESVHSILKKTGITEPLKALPTTTDLRPWCSPVEDQGSLGSCTANAAVGALEYFERRAFGRHTNASRLFLYKATRNFLRWTGDTGAFLRSTMGALAIFGAPPEEYWPYNVASFDQEPSAFCYSFAQSFQAIQYFRLDPFGTPRATLLNRIKTNLSAFLPSIFGFTVYSSYTQANTNGEIPSPVAGDSIVGGHAVMAVGYDDTRRIRNARPGSPETVGAILIRNSWGSSWGSAGYGWLPYDYVLRGLADDFWALVQSRWIDTGQFKAS